MANCKNVYQSSRGWAISTEDLTPEKELQRQFQTVLPLFVCLFVILSLYVNRAVDF